MKAKDWPPIKETIKHGNPRWIVDARHNGRGERRFFPTKKLAEGWAQQQKVKRANEGTGAFEMPAAERIDAAAALDLLRPYRISLRECAVFYVRHAATATGEKTVAQIVAEVLELKKSTGMSSRYLKDLRTRLAIFVKTFGERKAIDVSKSEVDDWIVALPHSGTTKNNYRRLLGVLFNFAVDRKYVLQVPISKQSRSASRKGKPGILTVDQCAVLLSHCDNEILPAVALGMFAGLRPESEIWRLDWNRVDFDRKQIDVEPLSTKNTGDNASVRFVEMPRNLVEWLLPHRKKSGAVSPTGDAYFSRLQSARKQAGIKEWPHDALRHCFCSYLYALTNDAGKTMAQAGHTNPRTFFMHYRARVQPEAAKRFFEITPSAEAGAKIVAIA